MTTAQLLLCFLSTTFIAIGAFAEDKYYPPKTPWHLADIWWKQSSETDDFRELTIDFEVIGELSEHTLLYIAPVGIGKLNDVSFYGGIQTDTGGWKSKESRTLVKIGKGGIFSRWSEDGQPITLDFAQGDATTHYESAGYEGNFVSVRNAFQWDEGKYRYSVRKLDSIEQDGDVFTWFGAYVYDYRNDKEHYIGSLKFNGATFTFWKNHAAFVEVYGGAKKSEIPQITVVFDAPVINGKRRITESTAINYPSNGYETNNLPRFAYSQVGKDKVAVITIPAGLNDGITREEH